MKDTFSTCQENKSSVATLMMYIVGKNHYHLLKKGVIKDSGRQLKMGGETGWCITSVPLTPSFSKHTLKPKVRYMGKHTWECPE